MEGATWRDPQPSCSIRVLRTVRNYKCVLFPTSLCLWAITPLQQTKCQSCLLREQPANKEKTKLPLFPRCSHHARLLNPLSLKQSPLREIKSRLSDFQPPSKEMTNETQLCYWSLFLKDHNRLVYEIKMDNNIPGIACSSLLRRYRVHQNLHIHMQKSALTPLLALIIFS